MPGEAIAKRRSTGLFSKELEMLSANDNELFEVSGGDVHGRSDGGWSDAVFEMGMAGRLGETLAGIFKLLDIM